jgi:hypothetical protein
MVDVRYEELFEYNHWHGSGTRSTSQELHHVNVPNTNFEAWLKVLYPQTRTQLVCNCYIFVQILRIHV